MLSKLYENQAVRTQIRRTDTSLMQLQESFLEMLGHLTGMDLSQDAMMRDRMASGMQTWESATGLKIDSEEFAKLVDRMSDALLK